MTFDPFGMPNINFSLINKEDSRWDEYKRQRLERGFDDSETWSLDSTLARFLYPRLVRYLQLAQNMIVIEDEDMKDLQILIKYLEYYCKPKSGTYEVFCYEEDKHLSIEKEAMAAFGRQFPKLWW